jgi:hypothetical protein
MLIRSEMQKGADRGKKDTLLKVNHEEITKQLKDADTFKPPSRLLHSQVLNSLWKPLHLGVTDGMVGFPQLFSRSFRSFLFTPEIKGRRFFIEFHSGVLRSS